MKKFVLALSAIAAVGLAAVAYADLRSAPPVVEVTAELSTTPAAVPPISDAKPETAAKGGCCAPKADAVATAKPAAKGGCCCSAVKADVKAEDGKVAAKADDKPVAKDEKTLTGTMACAKCGLKMAGIKKCTNALTVKDGDKSVVYLLDDKGNGEDYHEGLCGGGTKENAKVTGSITEKDGQKTIKPSKVDAK